ncbi:ATP-dependent helicase C-terminal domain-containing protein [Corynebacterium pseudodiphtheriticum]|uniref:ATP-dependent RNA helicase n=1 Tax=Corynebacterium pseudodiphtheriticum TaxID=37637 RepID=UPI0025429C17|nr:ATP-dependent helicase C-terminal domain-containing protein [Corynebacterium pseudodiphtheriticum]MDK4236724.1 ATP-dependent helicase C-terminal domain-containing protein [Corynebacterium pseudodiphtheriticum]
MFDLSRIGAGLPVAETIASLPAEGNVVVQAPPGTGKTTLLPPALANQAAQNAAQNAATERESSVGKIIVTAPRRVAVRAAAHRLRTLSGQPELAGHSIRGESVPGTAVEFVTPGVLLRRLLRDPELPGVAAVAIDEVHERQLDTDLVLGMCLELAQLRADFRVIAMSATVDAQRFSQLMDAPVHVTEAAIHPLEISYAPAPGRAAGERSFYRHLAQQAAEQASASAGSTLVFVPGVREVNQVCAELTTLVDANTPVFPLHGQQTTDEQDRALYTDSRRIVVATSIAESSLTVPGVRAVVDAGLARLPRRDAQRGMSGLVTASTSKSSADQRAGRAGREGQGTVVRCYSQEDYQHFAPHISPEILSADLTQAALFLDTWGAGDDFPLLDQPPATAMAAARTTLQRIGASKELALLPTDPRLGAALLRYGSGAAETIAKLDEEPRGDITRAPAQKRLAQRLAKLVPDLGPVDPGAVVAAAYPEQVARAVSAGASGLRTGSNSGAGSGSGASPSSGAGTSREYLLASGTRARLLSDSSLVDAEWLAVAEISLSNAGNAIIRSAARITEEDALEATGVEETTTATVDGGKIRGRKRRRAGAIELSSTPVQVTGDAAAEAVAESIREHGLGLFEWSASASNFYDRLRHLHEYYGPPWPDVAAADPAMWLAPELEQIAAGTAISKIDLYPALQRLLPWPEATRLEELAPERMPVPSGRSAWLDWSGARPVASVKLQECFGLVESPVYCGKRVQFHLLSPAGRPLAITDDLASFWSGPYAGVRAEMRGRYPKHPWPEDPWSATATAKTNAKLRKH